MQRLRCLVRKEFLELRMNPRLFGLVIIAPILQLTMLGYAATTDVKNVPLRRRRRRSVGGQPRARRAIRGLAKLHRRRHGDDRERDRALPRARHGIAGAVDSGRATAASIRAHRPVTVQVVADGTDSNSTTVALGYATSLIGGYAQDLAAEFAAESRGGADSTPPSGIDARIRVWFNPQLESRHFMIPGVLALVLLIVTANLAAMAIVREKELGTLEQLNVTPLRRWELIVGKLLPYGLIALIDVLLVSAVAVLWFEVPLRGSFALLFAMSLLYVLSTLALGLFISTISDTQQQAMMTATFFFLTPMIYLSGFIFPIENMPAVIQPFTYLIPLRYFLVIVRGIFLKGIGLDLLWPQAAALAAWGAVVLSLAVARSRKRAA